MKKLVISVKPTNQLLNEALGRLKKGQKKSSPPHYEISFTDKKRFKKFISNLDVLTAIQAFRPESIYDLAKYMQKDVGNLSKLLNFFEEIGALRLEEKTAGKRKIKKPTIDYKIIEFDIAA